MPNTTYKNIVPNADNTLDLGSSLLQFKDLYLSGTANIGTLATPYSKTVTVSPSGGDYTTIQAALDASGASTLILVYPGTYTNDTINFTANNQCVYSVGKPNVTIINNSAQIVEVGDYTSCAIVNMNIQFTPTTAVNGIEVNNGSLVIQQSRCMLTTSTNIAGATQPALIAVTGTGTITTKFGEFYYYHTGNTTNGIKAMFSVSGTGTIYWLRPCTSVITNSGTALASTIGYDSGNGSLNLTEACNITLTDTNATIVAGLGYIGGGGDIEFHKCNINVIGGGGNACYGIFHAGTGTVKSNYCDYDISGGATNYGFATAAGATIESDFDNVDAADGNSTTGTLITNSSFTDGSFTSSGDINCAGLTIEGTLNVKGGVIEDTDNEDLIIRTNSNANQLVLDNDGQVGIGGVPTSTFHIQYDDNLNCRFDSTPASTAKAAGFTVINDTSSGFFGIEGASAYFMSGSSDGDLVLNQNGAYNILFGTSNNIRMTLDASGNLTLNDANLRVDGGYIGLTADNDLMQLAANSLTVNGDTTTTGELKGSKQILQFTREDAVVVSALSAYFTDYGKQRTSATKGYTAIRAGSITGVSINYDITAEVGDSSSAIQVYVNGSSVWQNTLTLSGTIANDKEEHFTQARGTDTFSAGDTITVVLYGLGGATSATFDNVIIGLEIYSDS